MTTVLNSQLAAEKRFVLRNVSWETYEQLLKNYESQGAPRFTFDHGDLEIMSPSLAHEQVSEILQLLVNLICEECGLDVIGLGSMTYRRADLLRGVEPDGCFYIQNVKTMRGVSELDLAIHPPPDLVIEVDIASPSVPKIPIYAALGVPEIWQFQNDRITFLRLTEGLYVSIQESAALPKVFTDDVTRFVLESQTLKRPLWLRGVREWLRSVSRP